MLVPVENIAHTAGAVEATQVIVAVVLAGGGLSWGHLALVDVWGRGRQAVSGEGERTSLRPRLGFRAPPVTWPDLRGASSCLQVSHAQLSARGPGSLRPRCTTWRET